MAGQYEVTVRFAAEDIQEWCLRTDFADYVRENRNCRYGFKNDKLPNYKQYRLPCPSIEDITRVTMFRAKRKTRSPTLADEHKLVFRLPERLSSLVASSYKKHLEILRYFSEYFDLGSLVWSYLAPTDKTERLYVLVVANCESRTRDYRGMRVDSVHFDYHSLSVRYSQMSPEASAEEWDTKTLFLLGVHVSIDRLQPPVHRNTAIIKTINPGGKRTRKRKKMVDG